MNSGEIIALCAAALAGVIIGIGFFGGLWLTVRYGLRSKRPALLFSVSFLSRTLFALAGFYAIGANQWARLIACLLGFLGGRGLVAWLLPAQTKNKNQEATDAFNP
jgi:F1F0 ATPase subunit 2